MANHYFTINDFELVKAMHEDRVYITMEGLGPWGDKEGRIESFDISDAYFDCDELRDCCDEDSLTEEQKEMLDEECYLYVDDAKEIVPDVVEKWDANQIIVFNREIGQTRQNFLQFDRCIGDLYCDEDDYDEFMEEHEEFQTKEWKVQKAMKMLNELGLTVEDLK